MITVSFLLHSVLIISSRRNIHVPTRTVAFKLQEVPFHFTTRQSEQHNAAKKCVTYYKQLTCNANYLLDNGYYAYGCPLWRFIMV